MSGSKRANAVPDLHHRMSTMVPYAATTENITVTVRPVYLDHQSDMVGRRFVFGYFIRIENQSYDEVQLLRRHWFIRDASGHVQEVEGEGVIGQQPVIAPGEVHEYNSFCVLETFTGSMEGTYLMQRPNGERFRIVIPRFDLSAASN
jgi:ApaG protein